MNFPLEINSPLKSTNSLLKLDFPFYGVEKTLFYSHFGISQIGSFSSLNSNLFF